MMTKTYKHKTLWWIATLTKWHWYKINNIEEYRYSEEIENSNDRELQEEKDWIDEAREKYIDRIDDDFCCKEEWFSQEKEFRKAIEKYMPKIVKDELDNFKYIDYLWKEYVYKTPNWDIELLDKDKVIEYLRQKWLYLDK